MRTIVLVLACVACVGHGRRMQTPAAAFQPSKPTQTSNKVPKRGPDASMQLKQSVEEYEGAAQETNNKVWDPLGLADLGSPATLAWFRHAELKHGRVAMAAFVGWLVAASGMHFPGQLSFNQVPISFEEISKLGPMEQWEAVPELGKLQIILAIGIIEHNSEWKMKPHYMKGGTPGSYKHLKRFWDPIGFTSQMSEEKLKRQRLAELKNGRLAMFGIIGCLIAGNLPGSIPAPISWPAGPSFVMPFGPLSTYQN
mmetsp:Transcript_33914/g.60336  ORF Transcript_33914/g.60336 Transcript_33914/m.60336 type:complete len:254 (-) Transcript_33914:128-889(-)